MTSCSGDGKCVGGSEEHFLEERDSRPTGRYVCRDARMNRVSASIVVSIYVLARLSLTLDS
jgi:hypothetical protein